MFTCMVADEDDEPDIKKVKVEDGSATGAAPPPTPSLPPGMPNVGFHQSMPMGPSFSQSMGMPMPPGMGYGMPNSGPPGGHLPPGPPGHMMMGPPRPGPPTAPYPQAP